MPRVLEAQSSNLISRITTKNNFFIFTWTVHRKILDSIYNSAMTLSFHILSKSVSNFEVTPKYGVKR